MDSSKKGHHAREYYTVNWDLRTWLQGRSKVQAAARAIGLTDAALHLWMAKRRVPLMAHKALVTLYGPTDAALFREKLVVTHNKQPSLLPQQVLDLAMQYDRANAGERFGMAGGGFVYCTAPLNGEHPPQPEALPAPAPAVFREPLPVPTSLSPTEQVLLDLLLLMRYEGQQLIYTNAELQSKASLLDHQLHVERDRAAVLEREMKEWQQLAELGSANAPPVRTHAPATAIADTRKVLEKEAPALVAILDRLPKPTAHYS